MVKQVKNIILLLTSLKMFSYSYVKYEPTVALFTIQTVRSVLN